MQAQTPANGILLEAEYKDSKNYLVTCECGSPDHAHNIWVEKESDQFVSVTIYTKSNLKIVKNRWKTIWHLLTKGYAEYEVSILLDNQKAINYAAALKAAIEDLSKN